MDKEKGARKYTSSFSESPRQEKGARRYQCSLTGKIGSYQSKLFGTAHLKKNVFRYKAQIGHFPKEIESFVFVKRVDPRTLATKVTPELAYPIQANRPPVPKHALLEDDWRAFRSVFHNYQTLARSQTSDERRLKEYLECSMVAGRIYEKLAKGPRRSITLKNMAPTLALYKNSMDTPLGYVYRRYKQSKINNPDKNDPNTGRNQLKIPILVFEGPFMDTFHVSHGERVKATWDNEMKDYDADVIITKPVTRKTIIYNEPDAIPQSCARTDFSLTLTQRAIKMATSFGSETSTKNLKTSVPSGSKTAPRPYTHPHLRVSMLLNMNDNALTHEK